MGQGRLLQVFLGPGACAEIACPRELVPGPGQYLLALSDSEAAAPLATPIFAAGYVDSGFLAAPPVPGTLSPGISLTLRGPLGRGFNLPFGAQRVALAALGETPARLLPLVELALAQGASVLLLSEVVPASLPAAVEVLRPSGLAEALAWADYAALDLPSQALTGTIIGNLPRAALQTSSGEALITTPLPCAGMADCGACAVHLGRGYILACRDGPVVQLNRLS
jgi:dihydroorotate dehydrogenase electron transfer subunit